MNRRQALKLGIRGALSLGARGGVGLYGRRVFLPPEPSKRLGSVQDLSIRLYDSLDDQARDRGCVDYNHPRRQYHNRGVVGGGIDIDIGTFSREQRSILTDLLHAGLSAAGRERVPHQFFLRWPGVHLLRLLICGNPRDRDFQIILSGPHLNLRLGGASREGVAFGGPMVYGDQRGDSRQGLPGNIYGYQFQQGSRIFRELEPRQQQQAVLARTPVQTQIELQGRQGSFPGVQVGGLSAAARQGMRDLVEGMLSTYPPADAAYAMLCLEENGGTDGLFLSYYEEGEAAESGEFQIFRLEGPAAVLYFRGHPHVHACINTAMDGDSPLSVGEVLGWNPSVLQGTAVRSLFEDAMRHHAGTDLAYFPDQSVVGRLRAGTIRTGDIYTMESWQDSVATTRVRGDRLRGGLRQRFLAAGTPPDPERVYSTAATGHAAAAGGPPAGSGS